VPAGAVNLIVMFSASFESNTAGSETIFQIELDGVPKSAASVTITSGGDHASVSLIQELSAVAPGLRTVAISWTTSIGTAKIDPSLNTENANLVIMNTSV
jgi:hypothetical protein